MSEVKVVKVLPQHFDTQLDALAEILHACVNDGASVGFILPFTLEASRSFWQNAIEPSLHSDDNVLFVAVSDGETIGTVQLCCATMPNQPHRADVSKMLVHPNYQRKGVGKALLAALEAEAKLRNRTLLTLDTRTGDNAEPLYKSVGFQEAGIIPQFCRDTKTDRLDSTTYMYKILAV
jgi:GNAT superfamily N-acetyltransferase